MIIGVTHTQAIEFVIEHLAKEDEDREEGEEEEEQLEGQRAAASRLAGEGGAEIKAEEGEAAYSGQHTVPMTILYPPSVEREGSSGKVGREAMPEISSDGNTCSIPLVSGPSHPPLPQQQCQKLSQVEIDTIYSSPPLSHPLGTHSVAVKQQQCQKLSQVESDTMCSSPPLSHPLGTHSVAVKQQQCQKLSQAESDTMCSSPPLSHPLGTHSVAVKLQQESCTGSAYTTLATGGHEDTSTGRLQGGEEGTAVCERQQQQQQQNGEEVQQDGEEVQHSSGSVECQQCRADDAGGSCHRQQQQRPPQQQQQQEEESSGKKCQAKKGLRVSDKRQDKKPNRNKACPW